MSRFVLTTVLPLAAILCACAPNDRSPADSTAVQQTGASNAVDATAGFDPATRVATVVAREYAFVAPDTITAGWTTFRLKNEGKFLHHLSLVRIDSGKTAADFNAVLQHHEPPPAWAVAVGGPNVPNPGEESNATVHLDPGQYMMLCFVEMPDTTPHFIKGMVRPFVVVASSGPAGSEPPADVTITMADYSYSIEGTLTAGRHTIRVRNSGPQDHELAISLLAPGKTAKDFIEWTRSMQGPPPISALGGIVDMASGARATYVDADLPPGRYVLLCFIPDAKDGRPHLEHGMVRELTIQ